MVSQYLSHHAVTYHRMQLDGSAVKEIAEHLGLSEKTLWNKYGGDKLDKLIQLKVRELVLNLPAEHRRLLVAHLLEEVGLTRAEVERMLGIAVVGEVGGRVLEEDDLLELLGW